MINESVSPVATAEPAAPATQAASQKEAAPRTGGTILSKVEARVANTASQAVEQPVTPDVTTDTNQPSADNPDNPDAPEAGQPNPRSKTETTQFVSDEDIDDKLDALAKEKNIPSTPEATRMILRQLAYFDLIKNEADLLRLAQMSPEELQKDPLYQEMYDKNKDTLLIASAARGTTQTGRDKGAVAQMFADGLDFEGFDPDNPEATFEAITKNQNLTVGEVLAKMDEKAANPEEKKKNRGIFMRMALTSAKYAGEFIQGSLEDSSFSDFLKNFWQEVDNSNQGWDRYNQRSGETGAEMFSITQVEAFFKSPKDLHKTLQLTFEGLTKAQPQLARELPEALRESVDTFNTEKLLKVLMELQKIIKEFGEPAKKVLEHGLGEAMNRNKPEGVVIDERFYVKLEEMASNPQSEKGKKTYADFASHTFPQAA